MEKSELIKKISIASSKEDFTLLKTLVLEATGKGLVNDIYFRNSILRYVLVRCKNNKDIVSFIKKKVFEAHGKYDIYKETLNNITNDNIGKVVDVIKNGELQLNFRFTEFEPTLMQYAIQKGSDELIEKLYSLPDAINSALHFDINDISSISLSSISGIDWILSKDKLSLLKKLIDDNYIELIDSFISKTKFKSTCFDFIVKSIPYSINYYLGYCIKSHMNEEAMEIFDTYDIDLDYNGFLGRSYLNIASIYSNTNMIDFLLNKGLVINSFDDTHYSQDCKSIFYSKDYGIFYNKNYDIDTESSTIKSLINNDVYLEYKDNTDKNIFFYLADTYDDFTDDILLSH